jgi:hypothetical protein
MKVLRATLVLAVAAAGVAVLFGNSAAQQPKKPQVSRAVYWANPEVQIYLLEKASGGLRLTVISKKQLQVTYHTRINSIEPVVKILTPLSSNDGITIYDFNHNFTKMTIWMGLEFSAEGQAVPELTRTFLNDIQEVVANGYFDFGPRRKP